MNAETILAILLALQPPGRSSYSAVPERDGVVCDSEYTNGCRRETAGEGVARYATIARAIAEVSGGQCDLAARLIAIVHGESGLRRDVHSGVGNHARGDRGLSYGLGQRLLGAHGVTKRGWRGKELVGLDLASTRRAVVTIADDLLRSENHCSRVAVTTSFACSVRIYAGVRSARRDERILSRITSYQRALDLLTREEGCLREHSP
ncbi:MAG TPA: hypothetical protein VFB62_16965 [Polyangiaceae bacterium]|nr:hypothetical protein [Polyangiaceae bacterium]